MNSMVDYTNYKVQLSKDPVYYGSECTESEAMDICNHIKEKLQIDFNGIDIDIVNDCNGHSCNVTGPNKSIVNKIYYFMDCIWMDGL